MLTRSLRKSLTYLESVSSRDDIVITLRVASKDGKHTFHCNPIQALNHLFCSENRFCWMKVS